MLNFRLTNRAVLYRFLYSAGSGSTRQLSLSFSAMSAKRLFPSCSRNIVIFHRAHVSRPSGRTRHAIAQAGRFEKTMGEALLTRAALDGSRQDLCICRSNIGFELNRRAFFFFNDTAPSEIYTLSLHDALPI